MSAIGKESSLEEIAAVISEALERNGIDAVMSGGAAAAVYAENPYLTDDLDFVSSAPFAEIQTVLEALEFRRHTQRYFVHDNSEYLIEFPPGPVAVGGTIVRETAYVETKTGRIKILTPTHCVMDRLAAYYHWNDQQCFDQAVAVAELQSVDMKLIEDWSAKEGKENEFKRFRSRL